MKWSVWSATETPGTGKYKLDDCNPNCAPDAPSDMATGSDAQPAGPGLLVRGHPLVLVYCVLQVPGRPAEVTQGDAAPAESLDFLLGGHRGQAKLHQLPQFIVS